MQPHPLSLSPAAWILATALGTLAAPVHAQANLLANGSFENGLFTPDANGVERLGFPGSTALAGWSLFVGDVSWVDDANSYGVRATDGRRSLSLYDPTRPLVLVGSVQQTVATTPGLTYRLSFDVGSLAGYPAPVGVQAQAVGRAADFYVGAPDVTLGANSWSHHDWTFIATDPVTVIALVGHFGPGYVPGDKGYIGLDNVVLQAVPEPASYGLLGAGLALLAWRRRAGAAA